VSLDAASQYLLKLRSDASMFNTKAPLLKRRLSEGGKMGIFWFALGSPALVELAVSRGGDAVVLDMQHGLFARRDLEAAVGCLPPSIPCLVRIEDDSAAAVSRALDAGAEGVLVPMVETGAQAAAAAAACHFPPKGSRSGGGVRPLADFGAYRSAADEAITVGVMIETTRGVANAREIAAAPNVDFVFIGSGDLALSLGSDGAALEKALRAVRDACVAAGKPCGVFTMNAGEASKRAGEGFSITVVANDLSAVMTSFEASYRTFKVGDTSEHGASKA
jgi:2-keto-3-deoxy-L-rhamnonate aldolase RhmA